MSLNNEKVWAGKISTVIILFLSILSIVYQMLELNFRVINSVVELINDASAFMTIVCLAFGVIALRSSTKSYKLAVISGIDIILVNRLYSNTQLSITIAWIKKINKSQMFFSILACVFIMIIIYKIASKKKTAPVELKYDSDLQSSSNTAETSAVTIEGEDLIDNSVVFEKEDSDNTHLDGFKIGNLFIAVTCIIIIVTSFLYYLLYNKLQLNLKKIYMVDNIMNYLYFVAVICFAVLVALIILNLFLIWYKSFRKFLKEKIEGGSAFRISAIAALILEVSIILLANKINAIQITNIFLSAITDNWFSFIFSFIVFFLILQIACTIFFHIFGGVSEDDRIVPVLKEQITKIEENIVLIACNIIKGCVDLFDFIPDFFATIGILLLDRKKHIESDNIKPEEIKDK